MLRRQHAEIHRYYSPIEYIQRVSGVSFRPAEDTLTLIDPRIRIHQQRQCRDWSKLERWALDRTACYHHMNDTVVDTRDRYKLCPEGSPYNDKIAEIFGPNERQRIIELYGNDSGD